MKNVRAKQAMFLLKENILELLNNEALINLSHVKNLKIYSHPRIWLSKGVKKLEKFSNNQHPFIKIGLNVIEKFLKENIRNLKLLNNNESRVTVV